MSESELLNQHTPDVYFDVHKQQWWFQANNGDWIHGGKTIVTDCVGAVTGLPREQLAKMLRDAVMDRHVAWAGPMAGYGAGYREILGSRILVTTGPKLLEPQFGEWANLWRFLQELFGEEQMQWVLNWLAVAVRDLYGGPETWHYASQAVALCGPAGCGKSCFQHAIVTPLLGGRSAKPYQYMKGDTSFNADLFRAEHLLIEDEVSGKGYEARRAFGEALKNCVASKTVRCHPKNGTALDLEPFWRVTISLNDEPENVLVLPNMEPSLEDKISLLHCSVARVPENWDPSEDLRHLLFYLLHDHQLPPANPRYGVDAYHSEEILRLMNELSPVEQLDELIDRVLLDDRVVAWVGTVRDLVNEIRAVDGRSLDEVSRYTSVIGRTVAQLAKRFPEKYEEIAVVRGRKKYAIRPAKGGQLGNFPN